MFEQEEEFKFIFRLHGFHHVEKLLGCGLLVMPQQQCSVSSEDGVLDHSIGFGDVKIPLNETHQRGNNLHVLQGVLETVLTRSQRGWKRGLLEDRLDMLLCLAST